MARANKYRYPLFEVVWDDAEGEAGWQEVPEKLKPTLVRQIGFKVKEDDRYVFLAAAYIEKGDEEIVSSSDKIPRGMIVTMKEITARYKPNKE